MEPVLEIAYGADRTPAPGRLELVQRFVNTVDFEHGREMLSDPDRLGSVLAGLGLLEPDGRVTAADLRRALAVREALRSLALANNGGTATRGELDLLEQAAAGGRLGDLREGRLVVAALGKELVGGAGDRLASPLLLSLA